MAGVDIKNVQHTQRAPRESISLQSTEGINSRGQTRVVDPPFSDDQRRASRLQVACWVDLHLLLWTKCPPAERFCSCSTHWWPQRGSGLRLGG